MAVNKRLPADVKKGYLQPYNSWANRVAINAFVRDIPLSPSHPSYSDLGAVEEGLDSLRKRNIPMMVIWGAKDFCFNDHYYNEWRRRFPDADYHYLKDCGHYVLEDGWPEIQQLATRFFNID